MSAAPFHVSRRRAQRAWLDGEADWPLYARQLPVEVRRAGVRRLIAAHGFPRPKRIAPQSSLAAFWSAREVQLWSAEHSELLATMTGEAPAPVDDPAGDGPQQ